uniref:Putative secreted protein n=1 Tax=Ixodes ricinus TaxID=34613 RepID=A0A147BDZ8_IXORI
MLVSCLVVQVWMIQAVLCRNPPDRVIHQHFLKQVDAIIIHILQQTAQDVLRPVGEGGLVIWQLGHTWPRVLGRSAQRPEDAEELVNLRVAVEERPLVDHLNEDARDAPNVNGGGVAGRAEQYLRGPVPERDNLVGVHPDRDAEGPGQPKVGQLNVALLVDEKVLRLQISVEYPPPVAEQNPFQDLLQVALDYLCVHTLVLGKCVKILFEIHRKKLEHQVHLVLLHYYIL